LLLKCHPHASHKGIRVLELLWRLQGDFKTRLILSWGKPSRYPLIRRLGVPQKKSDDFEKVLLLLLLLLPLLLLLLLLVVVVVKVMLSVTSHTGSGRG
jgi:hypothetical protein